jgi:diguanylate cyclase (GGDEF)-like protein
MSLSKKQKKSPQIQDPGTRPAGPQRASKFAEILEQIRTPLSNRPDTEHELAFWRLGFLAVMLILTILQAPSIAYGLIRPATLTTIGALLAAVGILMHIVHEPDIVPARRYASIGLDLIYLSCMVPLLGESGAWLLPIYIVVAVGSSLRFGRTYGYAASIIGALGFLVAYRFDSTFWVHQTTLVGSWLLTMLLVPAYTAALGHRLEVLSESYRAHAKQLRSLATEDALTGLANRAFFKRVLERAMAQARLPQRAEGFAVLYCDLDGFKAVNDAHGHRAGDLLLQAVARTLKTCVRGSDTVARLGGDEFAVLLPGIHDVEIARRIGSNIVVRVKAINRIEGRAITMSCSVGITLVNAPLDELETLDQVLARADDAMYQAKRAGKNQFYLQWANA